MHIRKLTLAVISIFTILAAMPSTALAGRQCYLPAELHSEHILRLHSQLMVIAVTCRQGSKGQDLVRAYTAFTHDNIAMLRDAEQTMIRYYKDRYNDDGIAHLDKLRTQLGNEMGQESADDSAPLFCRLYRDRVVALYYNNPAQVQNEVNKMVATRKSLVPLCKKLASTAPVAKSAP
ncbi:MAG: hypothetical protein AB7H77_06000 [Bdellovibrionales bacterium]